MTEDEFGQRMNGIPKYVVSTTLTEATWNNTTVLRGDPVKEAARLKAEVSEILVAGSGRLVSALHAHGLIDEYRLMVFPIVLGSGKRLFGDSETATTLRLVSSQALESGTVILTYEPARGG